MAGTGRVRRGRDRGRDATVGAASAGRAKFAVSESGEVCGSVSGGCVESDIVEQAREVLETATPKLLRYGISDDALGVGLPCGGEIDRLRRALRVRVGDRLLALARGQVELVVVGEHDHGRVAVGLDAGECFVGPPRRSADGCVLRAVIGSQRTQARRRERLLAEG